jgi:hypothetical protein
MATYLQGVTDYIPQFQPFQPDLNLYANVLQTKQTRYDSNYKSLNNIYGQYYYADLTRDNNIERKEELIKNIDFNLKRVSGLDLSLDQNVAQATQVFKPFYEDQYLMKDMAWTKNFNNQRGKAEGLKNAQDEKRRAQYWDTGVRALDYTREEFKEIGDDGSLNFQNTSYTPYVNVTKKAQEIAKEAGLSIETVDFSKDGRWVVTTKNGEQLTEPLSKLFEASLGSDPAIQAVYKTQAYVNRKDYAYSNAAQFGGDKNTAEMKYLEESYVMLKQQNEARYTQLQSNSSVYDNQIADIEKQIKNGTASPQAEQYLLQLKQNKQINDGVLARVEKDNETLSEKQSTRETEGGFVNPYGDVESLRWKVDNAMASILMEKDLDEAAEIFAYKDAKQSVKANPYAVNEQKFQFDKALAHLRGSYQMEAVKLKNAGERKKMMDEHLLDSGAAGINLETGDIELLPGYDDIFNEASAEGNATDKINLKNLGRENAKRETQTTAVPYFNEMLTQLTLLKKSGKINDSQISQILSTGGKKMTIEQFREAMGNNPDNQYKFIRGQLGTTGLTQISNNFDNWVKQNSQLKEVSQNMSTYKSLSLSMGDYVNYLNEDQNWRKESSKVVIQQLESQGFKEAKYLYDEKGNLRSRDQFYQILSSKGISTGDAKKDIKVAEYKKLKEESSRITSAYRDNGKNSFYDNVQARKKAANDPRLKEIAAKQRKIVEEIGGISVSDLGKANASEYDKLINEAGKAYENTQVIKSPPGIGSMGTMSGTGLFTPGVQSVFVSPKAIGTKGVAYSREFMRDINQMDFGDVNKYQVSFTGATKGAMDQVKKGENPDINSIGEKLIKDLLANANYGKTKLQPYKLSAQAIAGNNANKSAMIITPDKEWLKTYLSTNKDANNNLLNTEQFNNILKNGISVIADNGAFNNTLLKSTYQDPLQMYVDRNPDGYTYVDPEGNGSYTLQKNPFGTSEYIGTYNFKYYDPNSNKMKDMVSTELGNYGNKLSQQRDIIAIDWFGNLNQHNKAAYNGRE